MGPAVAGILPENSGIAGIGAFSISRRFAPVFVLMCHGCVTDSAVERSVCPRSDIVGAQPPPPVWGTLEHWRRFWKLPATWVSGGCCPRVTGGRAARSAAPTGVGHSVGSKARGEA